jgi:hypothetical protein
MNIDRVIISEKYGIPLLDALDKVAYGKLITYGKDFGDILSKNGLNNFADLIEKLKLYGDTSDKKIIVYCDKVSYIQFISVWLKTICPELTVDAFKKFINYTLYKERAVSNTQLGSVSALNLSTLLSGLDGASNVFANQDVDPKQIQRIKDMKLNFSYELLLAEYLSGSTIHVDQLKSVVHLFLRRWFKEIFTDNRQMVLLNLTNERFQKTFDYTEDDFNINAKNPLSNISALKYYADETIWDTPTDLSSGVYGICKLEDLSQDQINGLRDTILSVFTNFEGMLIDNNNLSIMNWLEYAVADSITKEQLDQILSHVIKHPFDTCLVPRFDFQNVNFPFILDCLKKKNNAQGAELSVYKLI